MRILVLGGTGFIGTHLCRQLVMNGNDIIVLARNKRKAQSKLGKEVTVIEWNYSTQTLPNNLNNVDCIVNLAGESIGSRRWSREVKEKIFNSRIDTTQAIIKSIKEKIINPKTLINASAIGYYGPHDDKELNETSPVGHDFLAEVCLAWEREALRATDYGVRVSLIRIGVVLGEAGALQRMVTPFKLFVGGPIGTGEQWLSWIHIRDLINLVEFVLEMNHLSGPINATAPNPVKMKDFSNVLGQVMNRPSWLPVPSFILRIILGEMANLVLNGQKVLPKVLINAGFKFNYPQLKEALKDVIKLQNEV